MKKIYIAMVALLMGVTTCYSQDYIRNGNEFSVKKKTRASADEDVKTGYTWKTSNGKVYDIYISKKGACYILVTSQKTGKVYKSYLPKDVAVEIGREMGIRK